MNAIVEKPFSLDELQDFHGSDQWYRHWLRNIIYTDGVKHLAEQTKSYWLIDSVAIYLPQVRKKHCDHFYSIKFIAMSKDNSGVLKFEDGNNSVLKLIRVPYTDFPFKNIELTLFLVQGEDKYCLMVPSEY